MTLTVKHAKTNNIAAWTQADLNVQIAAGNYPPGTTIADITLSTDWNSNHTITGTLDQTQNNVAVDGVTITGNGTPGSPLVAAGGSGTVTSVSVTTANGISGSVATATTTPAITLTLGAITPTSVNGTTATEIGYVSSVTSSLQTQLNGKQASGNYITALTGDVTASGPGSSAATLATVNANVGSFGSSTSIPSFTVNAKGLITAASGNVVIAPAGTLTGTTLASNVVTSSLTSVGTLTNLTVTNPITGSVTGNAGTVSTISGLITAGTNVTITGSGTSGSPYNISASATGSTAFSALTGSTNTTAAMVVGSGASISATGTGTITATAATFPATAAPTYAAGKLVYDSDNESLTFFNNDSGVSLQVGQEEWIRVKNVTGSTIANGAAVYINGASTGLPTVALAQSNAAATTIGAGLATEAIANNAIGYITCIGVVHGLDTSAFTAGQTVYISPTVAGGLTATAPSAPNYRYRVGIVAVSSSTVGSIHVTPSTAALGNGTANQVFGMNNAGTAQELKTITAGTNVTVTGGAGTITISSTGGGSSGLPVSFQSTSFTATSSSPIDYVANASGSTLTVTLTPGNSGEYYYLSTDYGSVGLVTISGTLLNSGTGRVITSIAPGESYLVISAASIAPGVWFAIPQFTRYPVSLSTAMPVYSFY